MKKFIAILCTAALVATAQFAAAQTATFSTAIRDVTAAEVADGATAGAKVHDFIVTTTNDIVSVDQVDLTAITLYNNTSFGSNVEPPNPLLIPSFPSLGADSWITTPGATSTALAGDFSAANNSWFDTSNDGAQANFIFARLTTTQTGTFMGRVNLNNGAGGVANFPFSFALGEGGDPNEPVNTDPMITDPVNPQPTGLNRTFMFQFVATDAETPSGPFIWSIDSFGGGPAPNAPSIDNTGKFSWNTTGAQGGGTDYTAVVRVADQGGLFDTATLVINVPEPGTIVLAGLSLIGIVTSRRRLT